MAFELVDCFGDLCEQRKTLSKELVVADDRGVSYSGFLLLDKDDTPCVKHICIDSVPADMVLYISEWHVKK